MKEGLMGVVSGNDFLPAKRQGPFSPLNRVISECDSQSENEINMQALQSEGECVQRDKDRAPRNCVSGKKTNYLSLLNTGVLLLQLKAS
jgi:hypothetical protein